MTTLGYERTAMGHSSFGGAGIFSTERIASLVRSVEKDSDLVVRQEFGELISHLRAARYLQDVMAVRMKAGQALARRCP